MKRILEALYEVYTGFIVGLGVLLALLCLLYLLLHVTLLQFIVCLVAANALALLVEYYRPRNQKGR